MAAFSESINYQACWKWEGIVNPLFDQPVLNLKYIPFITTSFFANFPFQFILTPLTTLSYAL